MKKNVNEYGQEFWYARKLQLALEYKQWRRVCNVVDKAKEACTNGRNSVTDHFAGVGKMVNMYSCAGREINDIIYADYINLFIPQNK